MKAVIVHFRGSRKRKSECQMILQIDGVSSKDAAKELVGKVVAWVAPGKNKTTITGKVSAAHGNKGCVRAIFERGMPGQSLGTEVSVQ